jgi:hypothetical protein
MRRFVLMSLLALPLAAMPAAAQDSYRRPAESYGVNLVNTWIHQYLGRAPNRQDIAYGRMIDDGTRDPMTELAGILGCPEYYMNRAQGDDRIFIQTLFRDMLGRRPSPSEEQYWFSRLSDDPTDEGRNALTTAFVQQYPPDLPPPPRYYDRRDNPYWRPYLPEMRRR